MSFIPWQVWAGLGLIVVLILAYFAMKRAHERAAVAEVRADVGERGNEDARKAIEISEANRRLTDDQLRGKL